MTKDNKTLRILIDLVLIILGIVFLVFGIKDAIDYYESSQIPDNERFAKSYSNVDRDNNPYKYIDVKRANEIIDKDSGVIFFGSPSDPWSQVLVKHLANIVEDENIDIIYYLEIDDKFDADLLHASSQDISSPHVIVVKDGSIVGDISKKDMIDENYDGVPIEYFDDDKAMERLKNSLEGILQLK